MAIRMRTQVFECSDGVFFGTREEAEKHEARAQLRDAIERARIDAHEDTRHLRIADRGGVWEATREAYRAAHEAAYLDSLIRQGVITTSTTQSSED